MWLIHALTVAGLACDGPVPATQLSSTIDEAMLAYAAMEEDGFRESAKKAGELLPCLDAPVTPQLASSWHRLRAVDAFLSGDKATTSLEFASAKAIDPSYALSTRIAPPGGTLDELYKAAAPTPADTPLGLPAGATGWVDGAVATSRAAGRPVILQVGSGSSAKWTGVAQGPTVEVPAAVLAGFGPPAPPVVAAAPAPAPAAPAPAPAPAPSGDGGGDPSRGMWIASGATAVVSGALFGAAIATHGSYENDPSRSSYTLNHATYWGSVGGAGLTVVFAGLAIAL